MYATMVQCAMPAMTLPHARGRAGRTLATALGALPGFVAFVAFVAFDGDAGAITTLCLFDDRASMAEADRVIARWQRDDFGAAEIGLRYLGAGEVIVQKGL